VGNFRNNGGGYERVKYVKMRADVMSLETRVYVKLLYNAIITLIKHYK
jgi:hypothetical protein